MLRLLLLKPPCGFNSGGFQLLGGVLFAVFFLAGRIHVGVFFGAGVYIGPVFVGYVHVQSQGGVRFTKQEAPFGSGPTRVQVTNH